ncbi:bacterial sensory transduction regulator family protein [Caballeronia mineralivorans PML1(12)]|uniref:Bacterial sensory transduction regulator family protein n=1 Tax=Caballeronia mineralivorans PML1(12) TaxID=908627 RepID=A0A0J1CWX7_9BURK|nr:YbjN domain-containing protein [Caballeronia mineralivorans]KLU24886.1 bacterial sensory transduction regulator family protein [Caballeronia mineralivorans PML1(12)]
MKTDESSRREVPASEGLDVVHEAVLEAVSVEQLGDIFKTAGYRVTAAEQNGMVQLMSASQGVGFAIRFGNRSVVDGQYLDYTLSCALQVQGELPAEIVSDWNRAKRFARLWVQAQFLVLEMDIVVGGGVTSRHLRSTIELWDRLIQEFLLHLRNRPALAAEAMKQQAPVSAGTQTLAGDEGSEHKATLQ